MEGRHFGDQSRYLQFTSPNTVSFHTTQELPPNLSRPVTLVVIDRTITSLCCPRVITTPDLMSMPSRVAPSHHGPGIQHRRNSEGGLLQKNKTPGAHRHHGSLEAEWRPAHQRPQLRQGQLQLRQDYPVCQRHGGWRAQRAQWQAGWKWQHDCAISRAPAPSDAFTTTPENSINACASYYNYVFEQGLSLRVQESRLCHNLCNYCFYLGLFIDWNPSDTSCHLLRFNVTSGPQQALVCNTEVVLPHTAQVFMLDSWIINYKSSCSISYLSSEVKSRIPGVYYKYTELVILTYYLPLWGWPPSVTLGHKHNQTTISLCVSTIP